MYESIPGQIITKRPKGGNSGISSPKKKREEEMRIQLTRFAFFRMDFRGKPRERSENNTGPIGVR